MKEENQETNKLKCPQKIKTVKKSKQQNQQRRQSERQKNKENQNKTIKICRKTNKV